MTHYQTEEQQLEAIRDFFNKNSRLFLSLVVILILSIASFKYWQWHHEKVKTEASKVFESLIHAVDKGENKQIEAFAHRLTESYTQTIYGQAGALILARYHIQNGERDLAIKALSSVIDSQAFPALRQVARIRLARIYMDGHQYDKALNALTTTDDKHYETVVLELQGDIFGEQQQMAKAKEKYERAWVLGQEKGMVNEILRIKLGQLSLNHTRPL